MIRQYKIIEKIGKGAFGIVYKVKKINEPIIYVIKQISLNGLTKQQINQVKSEAKILSLIKSNYVVKYYESFIEKEDLNIVMEYCNNGDLCNFLKNQKKKSIPLKEDLIWQIFIKITLGLTTIHKMKILHRDLKTLNIFLNKDMGIKIGDLGVAKELNQVSFANTIIGTPYYLSPEMCEDKPYNQKSDVWALGCILYELCTFRHPFNATNQGALILKILNTNPDPIFACYSSNLQKLVNQILEKNYEKRPNCWDILSNPIVIEKAQKLGLYQEILNVCSNNNNYYYINNSMIENNYNNNMNISNEVIQNDNYNNYQYDSIPLDSENILLKSQLIAPDYNDNKILVRKLDKEEKRVLKENQNYKKSCVSVDKKIIRYNRNNIMNIDGLNQQGIIYKDINNNINLINYTPINNNYSPNTQYIINNNNYVFPNENYYLNNNYNYLYNNIDQNNINQNNIYNNIFVNNSMIANNNDISQIPNWNNEPVKYAKVTRIYSQPNHTQIFLRNNKKIGESIEDRNLDDISDSLNISVKVAPIDMDRLNDKIGSVTNNLEIKKENDNAFCSYPLNSDMPMDNCVEAYPSDNIKLINNITPLEIISNEKMEVKSNRKRSSNLPINNNMKLELNEIKQIDNDNISKKTNEDNNISSTNNSSLINQKNPNLNINIKEEPKKFLNKNIINNPNKKNINRYDIDDSFSSENKFIRKADKSTEIKTPLRMKKKITNKSILESNKDSNPKTIQRKKLNIANLLYQKNFQEKNDKKTNLNDKVNRNNKLNKTSINISSSLNDNFNINVAFQDPIPIENQLNSNRLNNDSDSDFNLFNNSNSDNSINNDDLKKDEQKIPKIDLGQQDTEEENILEMSAQLTKENIEKKKIIQEIDSLGNNLKKVKNDIYLLIGEEDYKIFMDYYSKTNNKDNLYVEIEKFADTNYPKEKKEKFMDLYLLLIKIDSQILEKEEEFKKLVL